MNAMGRSWGPLLVAFGIVLALVGLLAWTGALSWLGRLPGDLRFGSAHVRVYVPITSMLLVSLALSVVASLVLWLLRR
jgi:hypothetical protein